MTSVNETRLREKIGFTPHAGQETILKASSRDLAICAGRRFGKSAVAAYIALNELLKDNRRIWVVAPTYELAGKVFTYVARWFMKVAPSQRGGVSTRTPQRIVTARGSVLECKSADTPETLLGEEVDLLIVDEAAQIPRKVWELYLFPVTSSRKGRTVFISTPYGRNWFYEQFTALRDVGAFHFSSADNPYLPEGEFERAKEKLPENAFKQNYLAIFTEGAGQVFRNIRSCVGPCLEDAKPGRYVMGVDLAKHKDFTVLTVVNAETRKVAAWQRFSEVSWPLQKGRIIALARRYNHAKVIIDSTGLGDPISEDISREGFLVEDFRMSNKSKEQMVEKLSLFLEQKAVTIPQEDVLVDELESYQYDITEAGNVRYGAPAGLHDDCVVSLGLAVWGLQAPRTEKRQEEQRKQVRYSYT